MGFLRQLFRPSREEIWRQLCSEIGAQYVEGGFWKGDKVQAHCGQWSITLDTYSQSNGKTSTTYTRMRAPYVNKDGFQFHDLSERSFQRAWQVAGNAACGRGLPGLRRRLYHQGQRRSQTAGLFADPKIRQLIEMQQSSI